MLMIILVLLNCLYFCSPILYGAASAVYTNDKDLNGRLDETKTMYDGCVPRLP